MKTETGSQFVWKSLPHGEEMFTSRATGKCYVLSPCGRDFFVFYCEGEEQGSSLAVAMFGGRMPRTEALAAIERLDSRN